MSIVENGVIRQLSVSQIESFDPSQTGGCERKWWFERAHDLRPEQSTAQSEGEHGHAQLADYFLTGALPTKRRSMKKAVTGAIVKGELPKPGDDLLVELRFDGQPKFGPDGKWLPLDVENTLTLAGVPLEGFIDLAFRRGPIPEIWDHKFFTPQTQLPDPFVYLKKGADLIKTVQMPVYALSQMPYWPDAREWRLVHHYVSKDGVLSKIRHATVTTEQILARKVEIEAVIERMKIVARATDQNEVPAHATERTCSAFNGCPHQSICSAFKRRKSAVTELTPEEKAIFADLDSIPAEGAPTAPASAPPVAAPVIPAGGNAAPTPSASTIAEAAAPPCKCGVPITAENGSRLQDGTWKHVGCKLDAPPAEPKARRKRVPVIDTDENGTPVVPPAPPAAPVEKPVMLETSIPQPVVTTQPLTTKLIATTAPFVPVATLPPVGAEARLVLANLFENIATLLRKVA